MNFYSRADLKAKGLDKSNQTFLRWESKQLFPKRVVLPTGQVAWVASEVDAWFEQIVANREAPVARPGVEKVNEIRREGYTWGKGKAKTLGGLQSSQE